MTHTSKYFYGNKISDYGIEHGYVDYRTLAKSFDAVLNNDIINKTWGIIGEWELVSGCDYDEETEEYTEIYQYYIVSDNAISILEEAEEIVYYNEELDMYVWCVTHCGTSWDYILTNIKLELDNNN